MSSSKIMSSSLDDSVFDGVAREESVQSVLAGQQEVLSASDEIKALIGTAVSEQLSALKDEIIASMPSGSSGVVRTAKWVNLTTTGWLNSGDSTSISISGFTDASKMVLIPYHIYEDLTLTSYTKSSITFTVSAYISSVVTAFTGMIVEFY